MNKWTGVAEGVEYRTLNCDDVHFDLHLVRVDPKLAKIDAIVRLGATADDFGAHSLFAINANFFDEQFRPLGVVMSGGRELNPPHPVSWQSVFSVDDEGRAQIVPVKEWTGELRENAVAAAQCGPRLVIDGKANEVERAQPDARSGVCIEPSGKVVFFATPKDSQFDVHQMVNLAASSLGCRDAMLFDGGPSTQMFLRGSNGTVEVEGDKHVPAFVTISSRKR